MKDPLPPDPSANAVMQGEGDYRAARRHRQSLERHVATADIPAAARAAAPESEADAREMAVAEAEGKAHVAGRGAPTPAAPTAAPAARDRPASAR